MQTLYTTVKVHNEIELCEVSSEECKQLIERALLKERISYYIRWPKTSFFGIGHKKYLCIVCVNDNAKENAENIIRTICEESGHSVKFIFKKFANNYL